jgi:hypothetical protein
MGTAIGTVIGSIRTLARQPGQDRATIGSMSEPDAVPLPRDGEVFFDVRGDARSMRLSWYADSRVAVFSIWQGSRCTGTFRLPFTDLARMVQTLQSGPPMPAGPRGAAPEPSYHPTAEHPYADGHAWEQDRAGAPGYVDSSAYGADPGYGADPAYGADPGYGPDRGYRADQGFGAGQSYPADHGYAAEPGYSSGRDYAAGANYGADNSYEAAPPYGTAGDYGRSGEYGPSSEYSAPAPDYGYPAQPGAGIGLSDYDPPGYSDRPNYAEPPRNQGGGAHRRTSHADGSASHADGSASHADGSASFADGRASFADGRGDPLLAEPEAESVPDTAMMSFPSVPARNSPAGYR